MDIVLQIILVLSVLGLVLVFIMKPKKRKHLVLPISDEYRRILNDQVPFYQKLSAENKREFEERIQHFLSYIKITGVKTEVEDIDRVLIAASAVIPIFNFPGWEYLNLHEVLLYPGSFNHEFKQDGLHRSIIGMVGDGAMNHVMILSRHELRQSFINKKGKDNTAIHEFVHLIDKTDGNIDGVPAFILEKKYIIPWLQLMQKEMTRIIENRSDINSYGATSEAEFFAVVSEYFFERPRLLKDKHPELYSLLEKIFTPEKIQ